MSLPENLKCPDCDGPMVSRLNKSQGTRFWGCKKYPACKGTRDVDGLSKAERYKKSRDERDEEDNEEGDDSDYPTRRNPFD